MDRTVIKVRLKDILKNQKDKKILEYFIRKMNILSVHVYQFLRLWILGLDEIPEITTDIFHMCFKALTAGENQRGPKPKGEKELFYRKFQEFYEETYSKLNYEKIDATNLSSISSYAFIQMKTALENNIKSHYTSHVRRFVNKSFEQGLLTRKEFNNQLAAVKKDIFNHTLESPKQYHSWILEHGKQIVPEDYSVENLYENPQRYLSCLIYMSRKMEQEGIRQFQFFPQRSRLIPKHIMVDTKALIEIFSENKGEDLKILTKIQDTVWGKTFKMNNKVFRRKNWTFDHIITTNGYEASILFVRNEDYYIHQKRRADRVKFSKEARKFYKGKSPEEVEQIKRERKEEKKKKLKEEKKERDKSRKRKKSEFSYLEDASEEEKKEFEIRNYGIIDMGKIRIVTMLNKATGKIFKYTRRDEMNQTKRLSITRKNQKLREFFISGLEQTLSEYSSKTCQAEKYSKYIENRNKILLELSERYAIPQFRRLQFHLYINKTRARAKLPEKIKSFLSDITPPNSHPIKISTSPLLIFGNWSANKNMKHMVSTPGIGIKRFLIKYFKSYDIDEFRTSIINHKTKERNENLYLKNTGKIHSVLTYKMENGRLGCINRDRNAVLNMEEITTSILNTGEYPEIFRRSTKLPKADNPPTNQGEKNVSKSKSVKYQRVVPSILPFQGNVDGNRAYA